MSLKLNETNIQRQLENHIHSWEQQTCITFEYLITALLKHLLNSLLIELQTKPKKLYKIYGLIGGYDSVDQNLNLRIFDKNDQNAFVKKLQNSFLVIFLQNNQKHWKQKDLIYQQLGAKKSIWIFVRDESLVVQNKQNRHDVFSPANFKFHYKNANYNAWLLSNFGAGLRFKLETNLRFLHQFGSTVSSLKKEGLKRLRVPTILLHLGGLRGPL
jgi:hypothetical protein